MFDELAKFPKRESRFANAMAWFNSRPGLETAHVVNNYAWGDFGTGTVVDVGGSHGHVCIGISEVNCPSEP